MKKFNYNEQQVISSYAAFNTDLDIHIGKHVKFNNPTCLFEHETFLIRHIQTDYRGELAYNLVPVTGNYGLAGQFGKCANPNEVSFLNIEQ